MLLIWVGRWQSNQQSLIFVLFWSMPFQNYVRLELNWKIFKQIKNSYIKFLDNFFGVLGQVFFNELNWNEHWNARTPKIQNWFFWINNEWNKLKHSDRLSYLYTMTGQWVKRWRWLFRDRENKSDKSSETAETNGQIRGFWPDITHSIINKFKILLFIIGCCLAIYFFK